MIIVLMHSLGAEQIFRWRHSFLWRKSLLFPAWVLPCDTGVGEPVVVPRWISDRKYPQSWKVEHWQFCHWAIWSWSWKIWLSSLRMHMAFLHTWPNICNTSIAVVLSLLEYQCVVAERFSWSLVAQFRRRKMENRLNLSKQMSFPCQLGIQGRK